MWLTGATAECRRASPRVLYRLRRSPHACLGSSGCSPVACCVPRRQLRPGRTGAQPSLLQLHVTPGSIGCKASSPALSCLQKYDRSFNFLGQFGSGQVRGTRQQVAGRGMARHEAGAPNCHLQEPSRGCFRVPFVSVVRALPWPDPCTNSPADSLMSPSIHMPRPSCSQINTINGLCLDTSDNV